ncbi:hypothetical protein BTJ39_23225 [Izhakiella australiensis]|uniref:HTH luxR-type domain-containing protein n=2 Tax=Izhakiella australiensis TaxID=1926881 RepID=A0A1S8Y793_9GAMM|nr:hypothetical protein BTJ39_23225 [Izhakiella australiensis]
MYNNFFSDTKKNSKIRHYLNESLAHYDGINYVYAVMNKANTDKILIISDLPEHLVANYLKKKNQNIDPVIISALNRVTSFSWDENIKIRAQWSMKSIFRPVKPYNITSGYAFVLHDCKNNVVILSIYMDKYLMSEMSEKIEENKNKLQGLLINTHDMLLHAYLENKTTGNRLTARESEILSLCTTGKIYSEISALLHISVGTVKYHMANITKKLDARNAKHAITLATELNMISPSEHCI